MIAAEHLATRPRPRPRAAIAALAAAVALALGLTGCFGGSTGHAASSVTITPGGPVRTLPRSFFGFSVEYPELPLYERHLSSFERILKLLTVQGDGPLVLRIGGNSADLAYFDPGSRPLPPGAYRLTTRWFTRTATLIRQAGLRVLVDLNLHNSTPSVSARLAREAMLRFPAGSIIGFQVGNEPDRYGDGYAPAAYARAFRAYAVALHEFAGRVPLLGPAITSTSNNFTWLQDTLASTRAQLGVLDGHRYTLGACEHPGQPGYPTLAKLLGGGTTAGLVAAVKPAVLLAHQAGKRFRLDEFNSVSCGGRPGVSNAFATALWAPDALFWLLRTGLDAVNVHIRPTKINGPLALGRHGFVARPLLYGLALFARTLSPDGTLLRLRASPLGRLSAWAVRSSTGALHVLLINKRRAPITVRLVLGPRRSVAVQRLLAPSAAATTGVTLAGQQLAGDGRLTGARISRPVAGSNGRYRLIVPGQSAALVLATAA